MSFTPQFVIPTGGNPYYNTKASGGYNPCIGGNPARRVVGLDVLPNCVGYATGRFAEIIGEPRCQYLGNTNAANYIRLAKSQGLEISDEPTLGGVMVWTGGVGGYGHVAPVEAIIDKDIVQNSESEYYGKPFATYVRKRGSGNWRDGCYWMGKGFTYLGCIKNPAVEDDMTKAETTALIKAMFPDLFTKSMNEYNAQLKKMPADDYAVQALEWAKNEGILVGDATGNQMPQSPVKREDLAVVLYAKEQK